MTETTYMDSDFAANAIFWSGRAREAKARERNTPLKGRTVEVVRGRNVPIGTTGFVIWFGEGKWGERVGIKDAAGEVFWTAATNVRVIQPEEKVEEAAPAVDPAHGTTGCEACDGECRAHDVDCVCGTYDRCSAQRQATYRRTGNLRDLHRAYND